MNFEPSISALLDPIFYPLDPAKRIFWLSCITSLLLASMAVTIRNKKFDLKYQLASIFDAGYWFNSSSLTDLKWLFINNSIRVLVLVPLIGSHLWLTMKVGHMLNDYVGEAPQFAIPSFCSAGIYALVFFLAEDVSRFSLHCCMHRFTFLWRFHRVHHDATVLTPLTVFRVHPVEGVLYFFRGFLVFGIVSGFFVWLFGPNLSTWDILGVDLLGFIFNAVGANLRHTHVWLTFGVMEKWFISPVQHQLHHSIEHSHPNFGVCLAIWDRLFGTYQPSGPYRNLTFGLNEPKYF